MIINWELKKRISNTCGTQVSFCKRVGASEARVSRILRGHAQLTPEERSRWAKALMCGADELLEGRR